MNSLLDIKRWMAIGIVAGLAMGRGVAADAPVASDKPQSVWLTGAEEKALVNGVPKPPETGSAEDKADLTKVLKAQAERTPEKIEEAKTDATFSIALFTKVIGPDFTAEHDPAIFALLKKVDGQAGLIKDAAKDQWKRQRPFEAHPEVKAAVKAKGFSYPSGHSTHAFVFAAILSELYPDKASALQARAALIAQSRVDAGVHYPSDIEAGEALGKAIAQALLANPAFQAELATAKSEVGKK